MIPSRGFMRARPGVALQNSIFSRAPVRSIPRQASTGSPRQFGTRLRSHGKTFASKSPIGVLSVSGSRIGVAGILSSQAFVSSRRFASTESAAAASQAASSTTPPSPENFPHDFSSFAELDGTSLLNIPEAVGYLKNLGLDYGFGTTTLCEWMVEHLHFTAGMPWWASVLGVAVGLRVLLFKATLDASENSKIMAELKKDPRFDAAFTKMQDLTRSKDPNRMAQIMQARAEMSRIQKAAGVSMGKTFAPMLQIPIAFSMFRLMRGMTTLPVPGMETAGILWFTDFTVADPLYILPAISAISMYVSFKMQREFMSPQQAAIMKPMAYVLGPLGFICTANFTSGVTFYFALGGISQFLQTWLGMQPWVRNYFNLSPMQVYKDDGSTPKNPLAALFGSSNPPRGPAGPTYQAPRTVNTTARSAAAPAAAAKKPQEKEGVFQSFKVARDTVNDWAEKRRRRTDEAKRLDQILEMQKQRAADDKARFYERQQAALAQRQLKNKQKQQTKKNAK